MKNSGGQYHEHASSCPARRRLVRADLRRRILGRKGLPNYDGPRRAAKAGRPHPDFRRERAEGSPQGLGRFPDIVARGQRVAG